MIYVKTADTEADQVLPSAADLCASFQHAVFAHICKRLQRGMIYVDMKNMIPEGTRKLVRNRSSCSISL